MSSQRWSAFAGGLALAVIVGLGLAPPAAAAYSPDPIGPVGWVPDGPVHAIATSGDRVFVGGSFTGGVAALDANTGALLWSGDADGAVRALAVSADGDHLIAGGSFKSIGSAKHLRLASLQVGDGTVEPRWRASAGGNVRDIVIRGDVAYFGGQFGRHNGLFQKSLGAVQVSTGAKVPAFDAVADGPVYALATDGARLFIGGKFTQVSGQPRDTLASVTLATHALDPWRPSRACAKCNVQWDLLTHGGTVYAAGRNAGAVVAFHGATGGLRWRTTANGDAQALTMSDGLLYAGGHFVRIGSPAQPRTILAALNPANGAVDPAFSPRFVTTWPGIWALAATGTRLYVGGYFTGAGSSPPKRFPYFAMFG